MNLPEPDAHTCNAALACDWPEHLPECKPDAGWCIANCPRFPFIAAANLAPACGESVAEVSKDVLEEARYFVNAALDASGYDVSKDDEWAAFIEEYGNMGAYLMSAQSVLR